MRESSAAAAFTRDSSAGERRSSTSGSTQRSSSMTALLASLSEAQSASMPAAACCVWGEVSRRQERMDRTAAGVSATEAKAPPAPSAAAAMEKGVEVGAGGGSAALEGVGFAALVSVAEASLASLASPDAVGVDKEMPSVTPESSSVSISNTTPARTLGLWCCSNAGSEVTPPICTMARETAMPSRASQARAASACAGRDGRQDSCGPERASEASKMTIYLKEFSY